jgi:hypothetical protein
MKNFTNGIGGHHKTQRGIVTTIIIIVIALLVLSYYGFNLRSTVESPTTQSNFSYAWGGVVYTWDTYLKAPATYLWNIFVDDIWNPAIASINKIQNEQQPTGGTTLPPLPNAPVTP